MKGIDKFKEYFGAHDRQYAVIGGAACELLFDEAGLPFRSTKDIHMVLCAEVVDADFARTIADFINDGQYETRERADGRQAFHRFIKPKTPDFPAILELFSRAPSGVRLPEGMHLTRINSEGSVMSLSAILLDDDYYKALLEARETVKGVTIIDESILIPFKARAYLDLEHRKTNRERIDDSDIKKHRNDIFRLAQLLSADAEVRLPDPLAKDLIAFLTRVEDKQEVDPKSFGVPMTRDEACRLLRKVYRLSR